MTLRALPSDIAIMIRMLFIALSCAALLGGASRVTAQTTPSARREPVFDVHLHANFTPENTRATLIAMDSLNVRHAMYIGSFERPAYMNTLRTLVDAGLTDRIMFGSDGGPRFLAMGIEAIEQAPFLSAQQKRDILYENAMRFFKIGPQTPRRFSRACGS